MFLASSNKTCSYNTFIFPPKCVGTFIVLSLYNFHRGGLSSLSGFYVKLLIISKPVTLAQFKAK